MKNEDKGIIRSRLKELLKDKPVRMHMPGHKGKRHKYRYDITEIVGADNLHDPMDIIKRAQDKIARVYGADESVLLVGSTTAGLQAAVMAAVGHGEKILVPTNAHRSVYPALAFGQARPVYYKPGLRNPGMAVEAEAVKELVEANPDAKALIVVSPDFYGNISDLKAIKEALEGTDIALIVDQAHGAHLRFLEPQLDGVTAGAEYVVESTHKLLGAPTQGAVLHMNGSANSKKAKKLLSMLESTSPSYMIMSGIEDAVDEAQETAKDSFGRIYKAHDALANSQSEDDPMQLVTPEGLYDKSKFLFTVPDALEVQRRLIEDYRVIPELAYGNTLLCMTGIATSQRDINRLFGAVKLLNEALKEEGVKPAEDTNIVDGMVETFETEKSLSDVLGQTGTLKLLDESEGEVASDFVVPYPPGIPILIPGSKITKKDIENIKALVENKYMINGIEVKEDGDSPGIFIEVLES